MTKSELEELILELKEQVDKLVGVVDGWLSKSDEISEDSEWIWDRTEAKGVASALAKAFDWEECPFDPSNFSSWYDLHTFFYDISDGSIK